MKLKFGLNVSDFDIIEINEAFACQMVALERELKINKNQLNPLGGAVALGHPIGCSGGRIAVSLPYQLENSANGMGFAALCLGGGNGTGLIFQRSLN